MRTGRLGGSTSAASPSRIARQGPHEDASSYAAKPASANLGVTQLEAGAPSVVLDGRTLVTKSRAGQPMREWTPIEGRRNEALDVTVLALAALAGLGHAVIASLGALAEQANAAGEGAMPVAVGAEAGGRRVRSRGVW
ncbi:MAG: terminase gpA endonuclease subunit [Gemmatimonadales bacterium]